MLQAEAFMLEALREARKDGEEVPVGAVVVHEGRVIARAHNERKNDQPFAHAEILAMERAAQALGRRRLHGCTLYVTLEPCPLCAGGLILSQIDACVFGAFDPRQGCCGSVYDLPEDPDGPVFYEEIAWLLDLIEKNEKELRDLGVDFSDSQIWMIYYYVKQCNMEFDPDLMARMGKLGLKLCVSCQEI